MTYRLTFLENARKEWDKLESTIRQQFRKKLEERLCNPHIRKDKLSELKACYKIKLRTAGYRLVYQVIDDRVVVRVIAVGRRDKSAVYDVARQRIEEYA